MAKETEVLQVIRPIMWLFQVILVVWLLKYVWLCLCITVEQKLYSVINFHLGNLERKISSGARMFSPMAFRIQGVLLKIQMKLRGISP